MPANPHEFSRLAGFHGQLETGGPLAGAAIARIAPDIAQAGELAAGFAALVKNKASKNRATQFKAWLANARGTELNAFVCGIERDHDAVLAALVEPWRTGPVEGQINRLKLLKRSMYGRASHGLLQQCVLAGR